MNDQKACESSLVNVPLDTQDHDNQIDEDVSLDADQSLHAVTSQPRPQKTSRVPVCMPFDEAHSEREWSSGLCTCQSEQRPCCWMCCCWPYYRYAVSTRLGETPFMPLIPCAAFALRVKTRALFSIKGSILQDFFTALCCEPCVICQITRELDSVGL